MLFGPELFHLLFPLFPLLHGPIIDLLNVFLVLNKLFIALLCFFLSEYCLDLFIQSLPPIPHIQQLQRVFHRHFALELLVIHQKHHEVVQFAGLQP